MITPIAHIEWQVPAVEEPALVSSDQPAISALPHLILHFDMNRTLIATDREGKKTEHDVICSSLADQIADVWEESLPRMSYFHYVTHCLLPNPDHSKEIKLKHKEKIGEILSFLKEGNHPAYEDAQKTYDRALAALAKQEAQVFKSFYQLVEFLQREKISHTLIIRTYGSEAADIADELNERFGSGFFADFRAIKQGRLQGTEADLYQVLVNTDHHLVVRDDWEWWFKHGRNWEYGKLFPIDLNDPSRLSLFFDDNAKIEPLFPEENIVSPYDASNGQPIQPQELIEQNRLFPVEMLEALSDEDYYIRLLGRALAGSSVFN